MVLKALSIINFKSIATASCSFADKLNCFIGRNGMGKTNILDALHYLSFVRSHLGITDSLAIRQGESQAILDASYASSHGDERHLLLSIRAGQRKILKRNKKEYDRLSQHIGQFPLVIVSPEDDRLIYGGSEERRRFLDHQLSQQDPRYMAALVQYHKTLAQRNSLLKDAGATDALLDVLDLQLDQSAGYIYRVRRGFVADFAPQCSRYYSTICGAQEEVLLSYESSLHESEGELLPQLRESRGRDRLVGHTTRGIHKDELQMTLSGELLRRIGSQGQRKTFLIALKLAQYHHLSSTSAERPMLLLDDIFDRLDAERVERIITLVGGEEFGQIFITDTNRKYLDEIITRWGIDYRLFSVDDGHISTMV